MSQKILVAAGVLAAALAAASAHAAPIVQVGGTAAVGGGETSSVAGVSVIDFNVGSSLPAGVTLTLSGIGANLVTGSSGIAASPPGDTTRYLAISPVSGTPVTITIAGGANYIGFYAGSLDSFNSITFSGSSPSVTYTGTELAGFANLPATGNQAVGRYFNVYETGNAFTTVTLSSSDVAFELDNFAIGRAAPPVVPLPGTLAMLGLGAVALGAMRRAKK
jgi:hypothetical protein